MYVVCCPEELFYMIYCKVGSVKHYCPKKGRSAKKCNGKTQNFSLSHHTLVNVQNFHLFLSYGFTFTFTLLVNKSAV